MTCYPSISRTLLKALLCMLIFSLFPLALAAGQGRPSILGLVRNYAAQKPAGANARPAGRVLHFPKDLTNLKFLNIGSRHLTDRSLSCLADMKKLDFLCLMGNFTDDGLTELGHFDALTNLHIFTSGTLSPQAIQRLRKALPNMDPQYLRIEHNKTFK